MLISIDIVEPSQLKRMGDKDAFFLQLNPKDAYNQSNKIKEYALSYFTVGNFSQFNNIFSRYIKNMRDLDDTEVNDFLIKYFVSSVIKRNYEIAISEILIMRQNYNHIDMNIFIYLLKMISGNIYDAAELVLDINLDVNEEMWRLVSESDLAFYFTLSLLINFKRHPLKEIHLLNHKLVYKFYEENQNLLDLLENYSKCRFDWVIEEFESIQERILSDPLLSNNIIKICFELKNNILRLILNSCSSVSIDYLSKILKEKNLNKIENMIVNGISNGYLNVKIDDIEKIVYSQEVNSMSNCVNKTLHFSKKVFSNSVNKILNSTKSKTIDMKEADQNSFKKYYIEKNKGGDRNSVDQEYEGTYYR